MIVMFGIRGMSYRNFASMGIDFPKVDSSVLRKTAAPPLCPPYCSTYFFVEHKIETAVRPRFLDYQTIDLAKLHSYH